MKLILPEDTSDRLMAQARKLVLGADEQSANSLLDKIVREWLRQQGRTTT